MTVSTVSLKLLILLQPDIALWYVCQACIFCTTDSFATKLGGSIDLYWHSKYDGSSSHLIQLWLSSTGHKNAMPHTRTHIHTHTHARTHTHIHTHTHTLCNLHTSFLPDQIHLAKTWPSQPEPIWIQAGFAQCHPGWLWKNSTKSESGKLVVGRLHSARTGFGDSCTLACLQTRCTWKKGDQATQTGYGPVFHNMIMAFFGRMEPNRMQKDGSGIYLAPCWPLWPYRAVTKVLPIWHVYWE